MLTHSKRPVFPSLLLALGLAATQAYAEDLRVRVVAPDRAWLDETATVSYLLVDSSGVLADDLSGTRMVLTLDGGAFFSSQAAEGIVIENGGSDRILAEFIGGKFTIDIAAAKPTHVTFDVLDTEGLSVTMLTDVVENVEIDTGTAAAAETPHQFVTAPYNLPSDLDLTLEFRSWFELGDCCAYGYVELSNDDGASWSTLGRMTRETGNTRARSFDLMPFASQQVVFRFRLDVDADSPDSGWHIDDLGIRGFNPRTDFLSREEDTDRDGLTNLVEVESNTNPFARDTDGDSFPDGRDNCSTLANSSQSDLDADTTGDACDNCPALWNPQQLDDNADGIGNACTPANHGAESVLIHLGFPATDVAFDPIRPYAYLSDKPGQKVYFVNLETGQIDAQFDFAYMPESLSITPDGSRLFAALLTREHSSYWWDGEHEGYIASWDLGTQVKDRQFHITEDPYDILATSNGQLVVSSGSGQWTDIRTFDATTGVQLGVSNIRQRSRLALHPLEDRVYAANTDLSPSDIERFDLFPDGSIVRRWDSIYHGDHRMYGNVWANPSGDSLITRGGDVFTVGETRETDMIYIASLPQGNIGGLAFDTFQGVIFSSEGSSLHYYNLFTNLEIGGQAQGGEIDFVHATPDEVFTVQVGVAQTTIVSVTHPVPNGSTNTAPQAAFTVTPPSGGTTLTDFVFDASSSTDAQDGLAELTFRWDLDNDGVWDAPFSSDPELVLRFDTAGTKFIRMQVRDSLALVDDTTRQVDVAFEADPGGPGPSHPSFELPFSATDVAFDPIRPYAYVSDKAGQKVHFVNLETGFVELQFDFTFMPESLSITPDGSRLFAALLTREHSSYWWDGEHEGYIASWDLGTQVKDRQFHITEDPYDILATSNGQLVVSSGSGQWTDIRTFDATTGVQLGVSNIRQRSRSALHPLEDRVYAANTDSFPSDIERFDLLPDGNLAKRWDSIYHGHHRMNGNIWVNPVGNSVVTRGADVFTVGETRETDMIYIASLPQGNIGGLAFDTFQGVIFSSEGSSLHYYNLFTNLEIGGQAQGGEIDFVHATPDEVFTVQVGVAQTTIVSVTHPVPNGSTNTAPQAAFTVTPPSGGTTLTDFVFDASSSTDAQDGLAGLAFRWDLDNDGVWDAPFSSDPELALRFDTAGTKFVRLQVRDSLALVHEVTQQVDVAFEADPGGPGPAHPSFELPFSATDVAFDPIRPYAYVSDKAGRKVHFVNLETGFIELQFDFSLMPEALVITPDGSRLFAALLVQEHSSYWWDGEHEGYIASWDLDTQTKDRQFHIDEDPYDILATTNGQLVVSSGSGQWTYIRTFDASTGAELGARNGVRERSRLALHPLEDRFYAADRDIDRYDLMSDGAIQYRWDSHGDFSAGRYVWASPAGDFLVSGGGDLFTVGETSETDLDYIDSLSELGQFALSFDVLQGVIFAGEYSELHYYNIVSHLEIGSEDLGDTIDFLGASTDTIYGVLANEQTTTIVAVVHPVQDGADNTAPQAAFAITPPSGGTTLTDFVFDASGSTDAEQPLSELLFRWDFDNDGVWDTEFAPSPVVVKRFHTAGTKFIRLQVRDTVALVDDTTRQVDVAFEADPGEPGPIHPPYNMPFKVTDAAFDPIRPYLYVSDKVGRKVYIVNLETGLIERQFSFPYMPESLVITPDGTRLFAALLTREHSSYWWDGDHEGYIASWDLELQLKDRQFYINEDPSDILATSNGALVVASGSGQWTYIRTYDASTGSELGVSGIRQQSRLTLHPLEDRVYAANTGLSPSDIERFDLLPDGSIVGRWDSIYHGHHRMYGNVWASPAGDALVTRGGDVFTVGETRQTDMIYVTSMVPQILNGLVWVPARNEIVTIEGYNVKKYRLNDYQPLESIALSGWGQFVGDHDGTVYALVFGSSNTLIEAFPTNHPPVAVAATTMPEVECAGPQGAPVQLDGSGSTDEDSTPGTNDDIVAFEWYEGFGTADEALLGIGETLTVDLPLGGHLVTLRVTDREGESGVDDLVVTVVDTTSPVISVSLTPDLLWPPNHRLVDVEAAVVVTDVCGDTTPILESVTSSEPEDGIADGRTSQDIQDADVGTADFSFRLRAERSGHGPGRTYTAAYSATDGSGNTAAATAISFVPHDQGGITDPLVLYVESTAAGTMVYWSDVSDASSYDVIRGNLGEVRDTGSVIDLGTVTCIETNSGDTSTAGFEDSDLPPARQVRFYLVEYFSGFGVSYGSESAPSERAPGSGGCRALL